MYHPYTIFPLGDAALTVEFGDRIEERVNNRVWRLFRSLQEAGFSGLLDLVPAYTSLTLRYDPVVVRRQGDRNRTAFEQVVEWLEGQTPESEGGEDAARMLQVPVCYGGTYGPDLETLAAWSGRSAEEVVRMHAAPLYRVYLIGFQPGFAYLGEVPEAIAMPRRDTPRARVAAGSVGIAGKQTGIYPFDSPGGWQIIGQTPVRLFDTDAPSPSFFTPGDRVQFFSITEDEFAHYQSGTAR